MHSDLADHGLSIEGQFLKSESVSVSVSSIKGIEIRDGKHYLLRAWIIIGAICMMILSAWEEFISTLCFLPIIYAIAYPPKEVILKTTEGEVKALTVFNLFSENKAASIKRALDEALRFT